MINDIIYTEHYAKRIDLEVRKAATHYFAQGRQQGWTDAITAIQHIDKLGLEPTLDNFIMVLQNNVLNNHHDSEPYAESELKDTKQQKPSLSLVTN